MNVPFDCDRTCWPVKAQHHILYVTRIFYEYSCPTYEQIGAADFMPDLDLARSAYNLPTQADLSMARNACDASIMAKVDAWLLRIRVGTESVYLTVVHLLHVSFTGEL